MNTAVLTTRLDRRRGWRRGDHRLRAVLLPVWPPVPADDDRPFASLSCRQAPRRRPPAPERRVWPRPAAADHRQPARPVCGQRPRVAPHHGRAGHGDPRGAAFPARGHRDVPAGRRRGRHQRCARGRKAFHRGNAYSLAGMGSPPRHPVRVAGCGHPRRHHAATQHVRRHRRDHRGDDDVDSRGAGLRPQLGLPLLLAARQLLRRQRA